MTGAGGSVKIHIGGIRVSREPIVIETVLGSCVAVCLHDPVNRLGGMNHILLPGQADMNRFDASARYGINAMERLINRIMALGGHREALTAKAFGGASVLPEIAPENGIGMKNVEFVVEFLKRESIPLIGHDLGGIDTRRVLFHTDTGEVLLKRIPRIGRQSVGDEERRLMDKARLEAEKAGKIWIFKR